MTSSLTDMKTSPSARETGRRVLEIESDALAKLANGLDDAFDSAVECMLATPGRVIVSGMGKSGHVARKIAATLASTGTPAQFVHPGEASHGDLGMITRSDVILLLSNSGETAELADILAHARNNSIPLIGIAGRAQSTLLIKADHALLLPPAPEACIAGLAPTTSTTMTLALGDALAVALMEKRGFTPDNFHAFHPGGKLGARLARVQDLMHSGPEIPLVSMSEPMPEVLLTMSGKGFGVVGVTGDDGNLVGIITDGDLRRNMGDLMSRTAQDVMTQNPRTVAPRMRASDALVAMNDRKITCLFVCDADGGTPVGILHIHDCLRAGLG